LLQRMIDQSLLQAYENNTSRARRNAPFFLCNAMIPPFFVIIEPVYSKMCNAHSQPTRSGSTVVSTHDLCDL
jgi:hypothetical protein